MATDIAAWSSRAHSNLLGSGGAYYNGYVYQVGGENASYLSDVKYASIAADGTLGSWTATTSLPATRSYPGVAVCNGYLYCAGGANGSGQYSTVYYAQIAGDGTVGAWSTGTALPANRTYGAMIHDGFGQLLFVGGYTTGPATAHATVWTCTPNAGTGANGAWTVQTAMAANRYGHGLCRVGDYVYCIGGNNGSAHQSTVYRTTISTSGTTGTWTTTTALPAIRSWGACWGYSGAVYFVAGTSGTVQSTVYYGDVTLADGAISAWSTSANAYGAAGAYIGSAYRPNGRIACWGGYGAATYLANEYKTYLPELTVVVP